MTLNFESEYEKELPFDAREVAEKVFIFTMDYLGCPYEAEVSLLLTDDETIHQINKEQRDIDRATDVLSFRWQTMSQKVILHFWRRKGQTVFIRKRENYCLAIS